MQREIDARLHEAGFSDLRSAHGAAFQAIDPDGSRVSEMAAAAQMTAQGMGQLVADLERLGYVTRRPDPRDGRAKSKPTAARRRGQPAPRSPASAGFSASSHRRLLSRARAVEKDPL